MASKAQALALLLSLSVVLLLSVETKAQIAPSPTSGGGPDPAFPALVLRLEEVQQGLEKYVATIPPTSPSKPCLQNCLGIFKKGNEDLKRFIATKSNTDIGGGYDVFTGPEMESCRQCLKDAADPEISKFLSVFEEATAQAGDEASKQMS